MDQVTQAMPFSGMFGCPKAMTYKHTKFDDASFSRNREISGAVEF